MLFWYQASIFNLALVGCRHETDTTDTKKLSRAILHLPYATCVVASVIAGRPLFYI